MSDELNRIADAMERLAPISNEGPNFSENDVYLWGVMPDLSLIHI